MSALDDFRSEGCKICGENNKACLIAHHLDPYLKEMNIGDMNRNKVGTPRFKEELAKCICLCANCHMKLHAGELEL